MAFDSLDYLAACALFSACVGAWLLSAPLRTGARLYLRFAAMLLASLAAARLVALADAPSLFLLPLASASLMISVLTRFARPLPIMAASLVLAAALACGLAALVSGMTLLALVPALCFALAIIAACLNGVAVIPTVAGVSLLACDLALLEEGARAGVFLFCAAAVLGLARPYRARSSALAVEQ